MTLTASNSYDTTSEGPCTRDDAGTFANTLPFLIQTPVTAERGDVWATLTLRHQGARAVRVAYECHGPVGAPAVVVLGGISANRHCGASVRYPEKGWWQAQVGVGKPLDPQRHRLIGIDWLGADGELDGAIDTADQADALLAVLDALGIRSLHALIGASYGAMVGLQFAARHGQRLKQLLVVSAAHRAHPFASAWRSIQRNIVRLGQQGGCGDDGLALARQLALLSYRTPEEFAQRFDGAPVATDHAFEVAAEPYLKARGTEFAGRFNADAFVRLSESIDLHSIDPDRVHVPTTVVGIAEDRLVPINDIYDLAERLPALQRLHVLNSLYGHDAFLKETGAIGAVLRNVLGNESAVWA